MDESPGLTGD